MLTDTSVWLMLVLVFVAMITMTSGAVLAAGRLASYRWVRWKFVATGIVALLGSLSLTTELHLKWVGVILLAGVLALSVLRPGGKITRRTPKHRTTTVRGAPAVARQHAS